MAIKIQKLIFEVIDENNSQVPEDEQLEKSIDSILYESLADYKFSDNQWELGEHERAVSSWRQFFI